MAPIVEVILYVADMQRAVDFYTTHFGLTVTYPTGEVDSSNEFWVTLDAGGCILALHGGSQGRTGDDAPKIVFGTDNVEEERTRLQANGVTVGEIRMPAPGVAVADGVDPAGNPFSIELHALM